MINRYKTVLHKGEIEIVEKKSRFIATVIPVKNEDEAQQFIEKMKKKYWNARHNVFAYQIGERNQIQRYSDDGEPSGTAGLPILNILKGEDLKNVAVVVTRYFGGILLGTGGLVRAYGCVAKKGVIKAKIIEKVLCNKIKITIDYTLTGKVQYEILNEGCNIQDTIYTDKVDFIVLVEKDKSEQFLKNIEEITNKYVTIEKMGFAYGTIIDKEFRLFDY